MTLWHTSKVVYHTNLKLNVIFVSIIMSRKMEFANFNQILHPSIVYNSISMEIAKHVLQDYISTLLTKIVLMSRYQVVLKKMVIYA